MAMRPFLHLGIHYSFWAPGSPDQPPVIFGAQNENDPDCYNAWGSHFQYPLNGYPDVKQFCLSHGRLFDLDRYGVEGPPGKLHQENDNMQDHLLALSDHRRHSNLTLPLHFLV